MAAPAAEAARPSDMARWLRLLAPGEGRFEFAARIALVCALTVLVTLVYGTPEPALTAYVAFFLVRRDRATSVALSVAGTAFFTLLIGLLFLLATATLDHPPWRVASMAVVSFVLLFLVSASKLGAGGGILALIVGYGLDVLGRMPVGEAATRALLYVWLFVGIPAAVGALVSLLLAPSPLQLAQRAIARRLRLVAAVLRGGDSAASEALAESVREGDREVGVWLKLAAAEGGTAASRIAAMRRAADSSAELMAITASALPAAQPQLPQARRDALALSMEAMAQDVTSGGPVAAVAPRAPAASAGNTPSASLAAHVDQAFESTLAGVPETPTAAKPAAAPARGGGFLRPDAFTNSEHVYFALKTTGAAMFCYLLYSLLDWPTIHTAFITCFIVSLGTVAESVEKLALRIAGCLAGAVLGLATLVYVVPNLSSIGALVALVFAGALLAAWIAAGSPRIAYAGFQFAFAFLLCAVQGAGPAFDMVTIRDRVIGILLGNLVAYVALAHCWPIGVGKRIESGVSELLRRLAAMARAGGRAAGPPGQWLASLGAVQDDLDLARYEPPSVRPPEEWLALQRDALRHIGTLQVSLSMLARQDAATAAALAPRLERLADPSQAAPGDTPSQDEHEPLRAWALQELSGLERARAAMQDLRAPAGGADLRSSHAGA